jgi:SAM-dependent methyltransferase
MIAGAKRAVRKTAKATSGVWDPIYVALAKRRHGWSGPVPPIVQRLRVSGPGVGHFIDVGRTCRNIVLELVDKYGERRPGLEVLDFGAGVGRTLLHMPSEFTLHATDVDPEAIEFLRANCPGVDARVNDYDPPLRYPAESFDLVYSISIWTHLPVDAQMPWLAEMRRILRPSGLAILTIAGYRGLAVLRDIEPAWSNVTDEDLRLAGILYDAYPAESSAAQTPGITGSYGLTALSPDYVRENWPEAGFEVLEIHETSNQNFVVLRAV